MCIEQTTSSEKVVGVDTLPLKITKVVPEMLWLCFSGTRQRSKVSKSITTSLSKYSSLISSMYASDRKTMGLSIKSRDDITHS